MNPSLHPPAPHPGDLTLGFGDVVLSISVTPGDPYRLCCATKALANLSRSVARCYVRVFCRAVDIKDDPSSRPRLWLANTVIELEPQHLHPAREWIQRYADWIAHGDLADAKETA